MQVRHEYPHMPGQGSGCRRSTAIFGAILGALALIVAFGVTLLIHSAAQKLADMSYPMGATPVHHAPSVQLDAAQIPFSVPACTTQNYNWYEVWAKSPVLVNSVSPYGVYADVSALQKNAEVYCSAPAGNGAYVIRDVSGRDPGYIVVLYTTTRQIQERPDSTYNGSANQLWQFNPGAYLGGYNVESRYNSACWIEPADNTVFTYGPCSKTAPNQTFEAASLP